jgi:hypothetical protein
MDKAFTLKVTTLHIDPRICLSACWLLGAAADLHTHALATTLLGASAADSHTHALAKTPWSLAAAAAAAGCR